MGFKVGPYMVTETLGAGTFGKVKLAQHEESGAQYAIKIMDKHSITENELTLNVRREIAIMRALNHRNIVNLREVLCSRSKLYLVMDLVQGGELFEEIERRGEMDTKQARKYFQELVDGIHYCHRRGVFHRDLKPENLLVDADGTLKITDFGVSSMKADSNIGENDLLYTACGTPYYCAPEIITGAQGGYSGVKIDAWSCGIILYLLLTGGLPFQSEDMTKLYDEINQAKVFYPTSMDQDAKDLISNLLSKDPANRFSLQDVKKHPWFLVDYVDHQPEYGYNNLPANALGRRRSSNSSKLESSSENGRSAPSRVNSKSKRHAHKVRRSTDPVQAGNSIDGTKASSSSGVAPKAPVEPAEPENIPQTKDSVISSISEDPQGLVAQLKEPAASPVAEHKEAVSSPRMPTNNMNPTNGMEPEEAENRPPAVVNGVQSIESEDTPQVEKKDVSQPDEVLELAVLIRNALPGKPARRIETVVSQLEELGIECEEDLTFLATTLKTPAAVTRWLEEKSQLTSITCMRVAQFLFSK